jgi:membrane-bound lytic murein transglycosylase F
VRVSELKPRAGLSEVTSLLHMLTFCYRLTAATGKARAARTLYALLVTIGLGSCSGERDFTPAVERLDLERGDLPTLVERGRIRILSPPPASASGLPRQPHYVALEKRLVEAFVRSQGLDPQWVWVEEHDDLIPALVEGRGDIIAANLTVTPARAEQIAFSNPLKTVRERIVTLDSAPIESREDLSGREITVRRSSAFHETLEGIEGSDFTISAAPEDLTTEQILHRVARGGYGATVADDILIDEVSAYQPNLRAGLVVAEGRRLAWGIRRENTELLAAVNDFVGQYNPDTDRNDIFTGDLDGINERRVLRVLTRNNAAAYFVWHGEIMGFEHDLAKAFADSLGVQVEFIVVPTRFGLLSWLLQGRGDMVAAGLTATEEREQMSVAFSRPTAWVREVVVARPADSALQTPADLSGRTLVVRRASTYWNTAQRLKNAGIDVDIVVAHENMETEEIIAGVAAGEYDLTISDSDILEIELTWRDDIVGLFPVSDSVPLGWMVRESGEQLKAAMDAFLRREYRGLFYNMTRDKYFGNVRAVRTRASQRVSRTGVISRYDDIVRRYADRYGFDWLMITSQMFQESRFNPNAESFAGAVGLMQMLPKTARGFGFDSLTVPEHSIRAGTYYLRHLYELTDDAATPEDRLWFALASYNAGYGHVGDARRLTAELGGDPNVWFGGVDEVMPLLAKREYHSRTRYGYCRCMEPVLYIRRIRDRHQAYSDALGDGR